MDFTDRRLNRWAGYDYASDGVYFVTTCVRERRRILGSVVAGELHLTRAGHCVKECWEHIAILRAGLVTLDAFAVMPDHFHGILILQAQKVHSRAVTLSTIVGGFKAASARAIRQARPDLPMVWQRSFHDRVIRSEAELARIRQYVQDNPSKWVERHP